LYGDEAPSDSNLNNWPNEFNRGRRSLEDESRECHDAVRKMVMQDRHVAFLPPAYTRYYMKTWPQKGFVLVGSRTI